MIVATTTAGYEQGLNFDETGDRTVLAQLTGANLSPDHRTYLLSVEPRSGGAVYEVSVREQRAIGVDNVAGIGHCLVRAGEQYEAAFEIRAHRTVGPGPLGVN
jgi:hypothetical protein